MSVGGWAAVRARRAQGTDTEGGAGAAGAVQMRRHPPVTCNSEAPRGFMRSWRELEASGQARRRLHTDRETASGLRKRSRRSDLVSPWAADFFAYPLRSVNGAPDSAGEAPGSPESRRQDPPAGAAHGPTRSNACRTRTRRVRRPLAFVGLAAINGIERHRKLGELSPVSW
jgi:hypothetical protein